MLLDSIIFYFAAIVAIGSAVLMILQRNPVASVLYFLVSLVAQAILYVQLKALFLGALLIIIYAGAIMVLFLFVVMLLNLRGERFEGEKRGFGWATKFLIPVLLFFEIVTIIKQMVFPSEIVYKAASNFGSVEMVASKLFREYLFPFELTSVLLLVAIVAAVVAAKKERKDEGEEV